MQVNDPMTSVFNLTDCNKHQNLSRRSFLQSGLACVALLRAGHISSAQNITNSLSTATSKASAMTLGFSTYGMKSLKTEIALQHIADTGFDAVELTVWPDWDAAPGNMSPERRKAVAGQISDNNLKLTSLMEHIEPAADNAQHKLQLQRITSVFEMACDLEHHPSTSVYSSGPQRPLVQTVLGKGDWMQQRERLRDRLGDWLQAATSFQVVLAIKPHRGGVMSRPEQAVWLIEQLGSSPWLRMVYDYSHYAFRDMSVEQTVATALPWTAHVAVKDAVQQQEKVVFRLPGEEGTIPYAKLLKLLFDGGYRGDINCEVSGMVWNQTGYDPVAAARFCYQKMAQAFVDAAVPRP